MKCSDCGKQVRPVVVADIDGTMAQYHQAFGLHVHHYYNIPLDGFKPPYDGSVPFRDYLGLTQAQHRAAKLAYRQGGNKRWVQPYEDAPFMMRKFAEYGAEIWVATTRPYNRLDNIDPDTQEWLARYSIHYDGLLYGEDKYEQLIKAVDRDRICIVVEDLPDQMSEGLRLGLPMFQMYRDHNKSVRFMPGGEEHDALMLGLRNITLWNSRHAA